MFIIGCSHTLHVEIHLTILNKFSEVWIAPKIYALVYFRKYEFALEEVEGFRYRSRDAWRAVTRIAVREARLKEIKQELLNCKKLQVRKITNMYVLLRES